MLDTAEVSARLGVSTNEVRRLLANGDLLGSQRAARWFVPEREVRRLEFLPRDVGRPYAPDACWQLLGMLGGIVPNVSRQRAWQLRQFLDDEPLEVAARLRRRADRRVVHVHRGMIGDLLSSDGVTPSGLSAVNAVEADLIDVSGDAEIYVTPQQFSDLFDVFAAREDPMGNVTMRVLPPGQAIPPGHAVLRALVGLDLLESGEPRATAAGARLWLDALRSRP